MLKDPIEKIVAYGLKRAGISYQHESEAPNGTKLDFYLPEFDIYIEVKQFHSDRIEKQMAHVPNIIAIQGRAAALAFAKIINA